MNIQMFMGSHAVSTGKQLPKFRRIDLSIRRNIAEELFSSNIAALRKQRHIHNNCVSCADYTRATRVIRYMSH